MKLADYKPDFLLGLYRRMLLIRKFEERVKFLFLEGVMPGTIHQYHGQEACAVGVCAALQDDDVITSTHRPHGHCLAKGMEVEAMMGELFGKTTGCCKGKGGSMHMGDLSKGIVPAVAIVGGGVPIATGVALAFKMKKEKRVAVCFMGDGAINEGAFHEGVNMGAIWSLPVVYVIENNQYAMGTAIERSSSETHLYRRGASFNIPGAEVDGMDVLAVRDAGLKAAEHARSGKGPFILEMKTYRYRGHSMSDPQKYRTREEIDEVRKNRDPIDHLQERLEAAGWADDATLKAIDAEVKTIVADAAEFARTAPEPDPSELYTDVYVETAA